MSIPPGVLDRGVPDVVDTSALPVRLAVEVDYLAGRTSRWAEVGSGAPEGVRARALVVEGRSEDARAALRSAVRAGPADAQDLMSAIWAASRVGDQDIVAGLPLPGNDDVVDGFVCHDDFPLGPPEFAAGLLAAARGEVDSAVAHLADAVRAGDRRAPLWGALARVELSRLTWTAADLLPLDAPERSATTDDARRLALAARTFFVAGGYRHLVLATAGLFGSAEPVDRAEPRLGHLAEGESWSVGFGAMPPVPVPSSKGLIAIRHLVRNAGRSVPALELDLVARDEDPTSVDLAALRAELEAGELDEKGLRRHLFDPTVRSRTTKLVRRTIERLDRAHPVLAHHLAVTVSTGYACRYDGGFGVMWRF